MAEPVQGTPPTAPAAMSDLSADQRERAEAYWKENVRLITMLLAIWATVSYVCAYLLAQPLQNVKIGSLPFGFWFGQQGSIIVFCILILVYAIQMDKVDKKYGVNE